MTPLGVLSGAERRLCGAAQYEFRRNGFTGNTDHHGLDLDLGQELAAVGHSDLIEHRGLACIEWETGASGH
jgi:hypothetical protein